jgi:Zn-dependent peptidase ImmA (M78 family)
VKCECLNPAILIWAREEAGYSLNDVQQKHKRIDDWESGEDYPTYSQLEKLAQMYQRPVALFFFPEPPVEDTAKSLRSLFAVDYRLEPHLIKTIKKAEARQHFIKEIYKGNVSKFSEIFSDVSDLNFPEKIRNILDVSLDKQKSFIDSDKAFKLWRNAFYQQGIFVFKAPFKDDRISGFCLYDDEYPVIYINNSHTHNRQIFTLFHELAHLILKINVIELVDENDLSYFNDNAYVKIEKQCDEFAGKVLVPDADLVECFKYQSKKSFNDVISELAKLYSVSKQVILKRLIINGLISEQQFKSAYDGCCHNFEERSGSGGNFFNTHLTYLGKFYTEKVIDQYKKNIIDLDTTSMYLDLKPRNIPKIESKLMEAL